MAKFQYEFDRRPLETKRKRGTGKGLRLLVVFCIVAAVTAAVIFALIPRKVVADPAGKVEKTAGNENVSPGGEISDKKDNSGNITSQNTPETDTGTAGSDNSEVAADIAGNGKEAETKPVMENAGKKNSQQDFVKGVAGSTDAIPENDRAVYKKIGLQQQHSLSEIEALEKMVDPVEAGAKAAAFLKKEAAAGGVNSEYWARDGRVLANCVRWNEKNSRLSDSAEIYKVVPGDALARIARRKHTTVEGIKWMNKRKNNDLRIGEKLKILSGPWKVTVSRQARILNLWRKTGGNWEIFAVYDVGIGRTAKATPAGNFVISFSLKEPVQYGSENQQIPYGDPQNQLGDYFLKLAPATKVSSPLKGYGIHGSKDDTSIGRSLSNGCIRMRNGDVKVLYYLLPKNTPVEIAD